ncbi:MAG: glycosyltransferase [Polyangiaceae bacterium]|nr:glycosyltransferase [Polyangiaceae bacterium]
MSECALVIPCYNEENRLDVSEVLRLSSSPDVRVYLVDDGSRDRTHALIKDIASQSHGRIVALGLQKNGGKGEAVRFGMRAGVAAGATFVGYLDADFATPVDEIIRLKAIADTDSVDVVMASRIAMAGTAIRRKAVRHYIGRCFSTAASLALRAKFYDTQCGAKLFRNTPLLRASLDQPFRSRWIFDVEILARLLGGVDGLPGIPFSKFREVPLNAWVDVAGSRVRLREVATVGQDLLAVARDLRRRRRSV